MQIRFRLPAKETIFPDNNVGINQTAITFIEIDVNRWATKHGIEFTFRNLGDYMYLDFNDPANVSFFLLTYKSQYRSSSLKRVEAVDAQNNLIEDFLSV